MYSVGTYLILYQLAVRTGAYCSDIVTKVRSLTSRLPLIPKRSLHLESFPLHLSLIDITTK